MLRLNLEALLFDQRAQHWLLARVADDLDVLNGVGPTEWLGNEMPQPAPRRHRPIQWSLPDVISSDRVLQAPETDLTEVSALLRETIAEGSWLKCTFCVLLCMFLCDNLIDFVAAGSPDAVCKAFFKDYESRMTIGLCGEMGYSNDRSGRVVVPAKVPCEIAIVEQLYASALITAHNSRSGHTGRH